MFKPVMHSFHRTAAILKLTDKHSLQGAYAEEPKSQCSHFKQYHNSQWKTQTVNPRCMEQKEKSLSKQIDFFSLKLGCKLTQTTNYSWTNMYACTFVWTLTFLRFLGVERIDTGTTEVLFLLSFPQDIKACWKFFGVLVWPALVDPWSVLRVTLAGVLSAPR